MDISVPVFLQFPFVQTLMEQYSLFRNSFNVSSLKIHTLYLSQLFAQIRRRTAKNLKGCCKKNKSESTWQMLSWRRQDTGCENGTATTLTLEINTDRHIPTTIPRWENEFVGRRARHIGCHPGVPILVYFGLEIK